MRTWRIIRQRSRICTVFWWSRSSLPKSFHAGRDACWKQQRNTITLQADGWGGALCSCGGWSAREEQACVSSSQIHSSNCSIVTRAHCVEESAHQATFAHAAPGEWKWRAYGESLSLKPRLFACLSKNYNNACSSDIKTTKKNTFHFHFLSFHPTGSMHNRSVSTPLSASHELLTPTRCFVHFYYWFLFRPSLLELAQEPVSVWGQQTWPLS